MHALRNLVVRQVELIAQLGICRGGFNAIQIATLDVFNLGNRELVLVG
jgi:hypothetical protein